MSDYPQMIAQTNHIEPVPRLIRATLGGQVVLDTQRAVYVWESLSEMRLSDPGHKVDVDHEGGATHSLTGDL